jgi:hypothetical protein
MTATAAGSERVGDDDLDAVVRQMLDERAARPGA